jgi:acetylornithine deacetylase/succinyl-diaminopimelate desuccinylase-like protein
VAIGLRGMAALEVTLRTGAGDLHSGLYGGAAPNAAHAVAELAAGLHDASGRVAVEGFYDRVREVDDEERAAWARLPFDESSYLDAIGARGLIGEAGYPPMERLLGRPTLDVHGIWAGFQDPGVKTIIPAEAHLKLSCRLVPDQDPEEAAALLRRHVERHAPPWATVEVDLELAGAWPILTPAEHPGVRAAVAALRDGFGREALTVRTGWSVPIVAMLKRELGLDSVLLGFGLPTDGMHAPDEHIELELYHRGIRTMAAFWPRLAEEWRA